MDQTGTPKSAGSRPVSLRTSDAWYAMLLAGLGLHILFPKAGVKIGQIPLTVADLWFGVLLIPAFVAIWKVKGRGHLRKARYVLIAGMAYFSVRTLAMGMSSENLARLIALVVYPLIFFLMIYKIRSPRQVVRVVRLIGICFVLIVFYGLAQRAFGENAVLIRGLTANWSDAADPSFLEDKSNFFQETGQLKLTSTYQNGANLGINLVLLFPIAMLGLSKRMRAFAVPAAVLVIGWAGARSAWLGLLFLVGLWLMLKEKSWKRRILWATIATSWALFFALYSSLGQLRIQGNPEDWLFSWSGRLAGALVIWQDALGSSLLSLLFGIHASSESYAYEMVYLSIFETYGLLGLLVWALPFAVSLYVFFKHRQNTLVNAAFFAVAAWLFMAVSEGAFWVPPTSFNVWSVMALGWCAVLCSSGSSVGILLRQKLGTAPLALTLNPRNVGQS